MNQYIAYINIYIKGSSILHSLWHPSWLSSIGNFSEEAQHYHKWYICAAWLGIKNQFLLRDVSLYMIKHQYWNRKKRTLLFHH